MDRAAVFVDAGYLFASGSQLIADARLPRGELYLDHDVVLRLLRRLVAELTSLPLLRIYWYDGASAGPTSQQLALAYQPDVKLRLGMVNPEGHQSGVDALLISDLITLSRNRALADAVLLTGDDDIRVGVQQAQEYGVRVHLLGIAPTQDNQAGSLAREADSLRELGISEVQSFLSRLPPPEVGAKAAPAGLLGLESRVDSLHLEATAQRLASELNSAELSALLAQGEGGSVPAALDRRLLLAGTHCAGGGELSAKQKRQLRAAFLEACRTLKP